MVIRRIMFICITGFFLLGPAQGFAGLTSTESKGFTERCGELLRGFLQRIPFFVEPVPRTVTDLNPAVQRWLELRQEYFNQINDYGLKSVGDFINIGKNRYEIVARLGKGEEGKVYLVSTPFGLRTAKNFNKPGAAEHFASNPSLAKHFKTPIILETDVINNTLLLEYLEGVPVHEIERNYAQIGITREEKNKIMHHWEEIRGKAINSNGAEVWGDNAIYSFKDHNFKIFDAR